MILQLPQIQEAPEIASVNETNAFMRNYSSLIIEWEEDSTNVVELSSFLPIKESPANLIIMNQCYMKGKINEL